MGQTIDWRGIFIIPVTPFHPDLSLDLESMERQIAFCLACGVQGIVGPGVAGEFFTLSDEERIEVIRVMTQATGGKVPVIAGIPGSSKHHAVALAKAAMAAGVDGFMAMPPYSDKGPYARTLDYYQAIAEAAPLPMVLQNADNFFGFPLSMDEVAQLTASVPTIQVVKQETQPSPQRVGQLLGKLKNPEGGAAGATRNNQVQGVFGGLGGFALFNELRRGAAGTMPATEFADLFVQVYRLWADGQEAEARTLFNVMLPGIVMERLYGMAFMKAFLVRRGVIRHATLRAGQPALDADDQAELELLYEALEPHFSVKGF